MTDTTAITVIPLETPTLGDRSYLVHDSEVAFVVDPQRDIDRAGYRASIAASLLAAAGHQLVAIDDAFDNARKAALSVAAKDAT